MSTEARVKKQVEAIQVSLKDGAESTLRTAELIAEVADADESTVQDALKAHMSAPTFSKYRKVGKNPRFDDADLRKRLPTSIDTLYDITRIEDNEWHALRDKIQPGITRKDVRELIPRKTRDLPAWLVARISTTDDAAISGGTLDELASWCEKHDLKISFTKRAVGNDARQPEPERAKVQNWAAVWPSDTEPEDDRIESTILPAMVVRRLPPLARNAAEYEQLLRSASPLSCTS